MYCRFKVSKQGGVGGTGWGWHKATPEVLLLAPLGWGGGILWLKVLLITEVMGGEALDGICVISMVFTRCQRAYINIYTVYIGVELFMVMFRCVWFYHCFIIVRNPLVVFPYILFHVVLTETGVISKNYSFKFTVTESHGTLIVWKHTSIIILLIIFCLFLAYSYIFNILVYV